MDQDGQMQDVRALPMLLWAVQFLSGAYLVSDDYAAEVDSVQHLQESNVDFNQARSTDDQFCFNNARFSCNPVLEKIELIEELF